MKVILVDDELLALKKLEKLLSEFEDLEVIGSYQSATHALREIEQLRPDVVFLDINMPEINGLQVARVIRERAPLTSIVFATAYNSYLQEASELDALDYIMKPIQKECLVNTLQRLR